MTRPSSLLLTHDAMMIEQIQMIHDESDSARLEVCGRTEKALSCLADETKLLLIDSGTAQPGLNVLLSTAKRLRTPAIVVVPTHEGLPYDATPQLDHMAEFRDHPICSLPAGLPALRNLIKNIIAGEGLTADVPAVDPIAAALLGSELQEYLSVIRRVAGQNTTILLSGETGCGKSMLGKLIHEASPRKAEPYLVVDCGALSGHLIESEMFGHTRGAFTGADRERQGKFVAAGTGTLVLDEINSLPLPLQAKLLRAVEDRVFEPVGSNRSEQLRARLIAVSNVPLEDEVRRERFRSDLFYRLNVVELRLPPLRDRREAILPLAQHFLHTIAPGSQQSIIAPQALVAMHEYSWPGNVRELRNVIERAMVLAAGPVIRLADLPAHIRERATCSVSTSIPFCPSHTMPVTVAEQEDHGIGTMLDETLEEGLGVNERALLVALLEKHRNNRQRAAQELGVSRMTLYKKLHKLGIFVPKSKSGVIRYCREILGTPSEYAVAVPPT